MAEVKKTTSGASVAKAGAAKPAVGAQPTKKPATGGSGAVGDLMDAFDECPLPESTPKLGEPGFHFGL